MLLLDFVKLSAIDRAVEILNNHDGMDDHCTTDLMFAATKKKYKAAKVEILSWYDLSEDQKDDHIEHDDQDGSYFVYNDMVWNLNEFMRSCWGDNWLAAASISNTAAIVIYGLDSDHAIVGMVY